MPCFREASFRDQEGFLREMSETFLKISSRQQNLIRGKFCDSGKVSAQDLKTNSELLEAGS